MKKIIVTGAAGHVGLNLLTLLDTSKYEIIAIDKSSNNLQIVKNINPKISILHADLSVRDKKWEKLFEKAYCVIQLQCQLSGKTQEPYIRNNITSVKNVIDVCEKYKIKNLIHFSSISVISVAKGYYNKTKKAGEKLVKKSKLSYTILRPTLMYGCFDAKHLGFMTKLLEKSPVFPIPGNGKYIRQPLYIKDVVKIIVNLTEKKPERKVYNIVGREKIYFIDIIKIIARARKKNSIIIRIPIPIFVFLLKLYSIITNKSPFIRPQLTALTAGDVFEVTNWEKQFRVKYTPFRQGIEDMFRSEYYVYRDKMHI